MTDALAVDSRIWTSRPAVGDGYGYLYVIEFDTGVVKVGKTTDPAARMATHISQAAAYRATLTAAWFSEAHLGYAGNETAVLAHVVSKQLGKQVRREYFHDADFTQVVDVAERACRGEDLDGQMSLIDIAEALNVVTTVLPRIIKAEPGHLTPAQRVHVITALIDLAGRITSLDRRIGEIEHGGSQLDIAARSATMVSELETMLANAQLAQRRDGGA